MPDVAPLRTEDPARLGGYQLLGRLGEGGQGTVYLARTGSGVRVAVKTLNTASISDPPARRRFAAEVALVRQVSSFCVAEVLDADLDSARPYIVSEYVDGPSLYESVTEGGPRTGGTLRRLAVGTVTALAAIHQAGIVHRDFKPHNVLLGQDGPRVIDFGIARVLDAAATTTGTVVGTVAYMSPEQVTAGDIGPASDMFSWAATMAFAAGAQPLFGRDSIPAIMHRILSTYPELPAMPGDLGAVVGACLAKDPAQRPSARDVLLRFIGDNDVAATDPSPQAPRTSPLPVTGRQRTRSDHEPPHLTNVATGPAGGGPGAGRRRGWVIAGAAAAAALVVGGGIIAVMVQSGGSPGGGGTKGLPQVAPTGTLLYADNFDERGGWDGYNFKPDTTGPERSTHGYEVDRGVYSMQADKTDVTNMSLSPVPPKKAATEAAPAERNVMISVTAVLEKGARAPAEFGLLCRRDEEVGTGYSFLVNLNGTARIVRNAVGVPTNLAPPTTITAPAGGRPLRLQAACRTNGTATRLTLWLNGVQAIDVTDPQVLPESTYDQVGLVAQIRDGSDGYVRLSFDDFALHRAQ